MQTKAYRIENMSGMTFESEGPTDFWAQAGTPRACRLTAEELAGMPEEESRQIDTLRTRLSELFVTRFGANYMRLYSECAIEKSIFQKVLRFRNGRNITYRLLAKFCVGAKLTIEEAEALFLLMGHVLYDKNRSDYILKCALYGHKDIVEYDEDLKEAGLKGIFTPEKEDDED